MWKIFEKSWEFHSFHNCLSESYIGRITKTFQEFVSIKKKNKIVSSQENIDLDRKSVAEDSEMSIRWRSQVTRIKLWKHIEFEIIGAKTIRSFKTGQQFPGRIICRNGDIIWAQKSCDLKPLDYFLWIYVRI